jgi:glycosyltransferase involved in cell wall biosynthesis
MTSAPLVTVIVPIYKAEPYIERCLQSLGAQSLTPIEILLIDDGSPDSCGEICDKYAQHYPYFRVIHKSNEGVSATRELGIRQARGEYSIQVDPDDWIDTDMLEEMYTKAKVDDADMVICDMQIIKKNRVHYSCQKPSILNPYVILKEIFTTLHGSCCNKLVRQNLFKQYNIHYPEGLVLCEDLYVTSSLLSHNIRVSYIPKAFYHYDQTINSNSIIKNYGNDTLQKDLRMFRAFDELSQSFGTNRLTCLQQMAQLIVSRAMKGGFLNSKDFAQTFAFTIPYIKSNPRLKPLRKFRFIAACQGYYFLFRPFILIARKIRSVLL